MAKQHDDSKPLYYPSEHRANKLANWQFKRGGLSMIFETPCDL